MPSVCWQSYSNRSMVSAVLRIGAVLCLLVHLVVPPTVSGDSITSVVFLVDDPRVLASSESIQIHPAIMKYTMSCGSRDELFHARIGTGSWSTCEDKFFFYSATMKVPSGKSALDIVFFFLVFLHSFSSSF